MAVRISTHAKEEGTIVFTAAFTDEEDNAVTPNTITWTLTDAAGTVINTRSNEIVTPATSVKIVLSGDDLALQADESGIVKRLLTIYYEYDSTNGTDLPDHKEVWFYVDGSTMVPAAP